ncbi:hypothetical protein LTR62_006843 [Meristemomyces frigidus]|uniref:AAA+ ATPase domain-containing protein n=1 Tax=Meristemomyces frigidus TaxID=1508187 RepID=A0AAN7YE75_9PEZI|nr:hypothetical protein LTR62_006843 [Meristemomyces frigidus]
MSRRTASKDIPSPIVPTPAPTPSEPGSSASQSLRNMDVNGNLEEKRDGTVEEPIVEKDVMEPAKKVDEEEDVRKTKSKKTCRKRGHKKEAAKKAHGKKAKVESSDSDSSASDEDSSAESDSENDSSEEEKAAAKRKHGAKGKKDKKRRKSVSESESASNSAESSDEDLPKPKRSKKARKLPAHDSSDEPCSASDSDDEVAKLQAELDALRLLRAAKKTKTTRRRHSKEKETKSTKKSKSKSSKSKSSKSKSSKAAGKDFRRVDQLFDSTLHDYTLVPSAEEQDNEYAEHAFLIRRCFTWENKYTETVVDIKAKQLRTVLQAVMKDCKSVSLEAEEPTIDPNVLFLYLEEFRTHYKKTLKVDIKAEKKKKAVKKLETQRKLCKSLVKYIDEDYKDIKKTLYPLLEAGNITFDLMWALFKPNEIAVTSCYGSWDEARCFRVEYANKCCSMQRGDWYNIEGKYLEYDGKAFGYGDFEIDVDGFKGPRKISSLSTYPLKYHKDPERLRKKIMARGKQFLAMDGMQYKYHKGMAFMKKKKTVAKININGRVMIDPATFRRINPNYPISFVKPKDSDDLFSMSDDDDDCSCCDEGEDDAEANQAGPKNVDHGDSAPKYKYTYTTLESGQEVITAVEVDENGDRIPNQRVESLAAHPDLKTREFTEEELLLTSPVVLGFSFSDKLWLEFTISGVKEIEYNDQAFESLVLPDNQKEIVRALVESHKFNAARTIDDVVQGKGKGLVSVLHGPPGTGKTLTAEGISELLKCPLYMVSAGELGTDPGKLEYELQKILDIAHSWGAVLLLDEADVFLEKREVHDIHRNALVSIFLRLLEYFQGILFLTTNRVDTFDPAFQSRIHLPLRYSELTHQAKKKIWTLFLDLVRKSDPALSSLSSSSSSSSSSTSIAEFSDADLESLSRFQMNGRQIKNCVRTAQALALREGGKLEMRHLRQVVEVGESFERDLRGGTGYEDAMRSYT